MEPIISKLQEGVKYPRFERDATTIINDLVEHITKERGVYSSNIEPNPNEHKVWFNTNNNTLNIYENGKWNTISGQGGGSSSGAHFFNAVLGGTTNNASGVISGGVISGATISGGYINNAYINANGAYMGSITITNGNIGGNILLTGTISGGFIHGATLGAINVTSGSINYARINNAYISDGILTGTINASAATISGGNIDANKIKASGIETPLINLTSGSTNKLIQLIGDNYIFAGKLADSTLFHSIDLSHGSIAGLTSIKTLSYTGLSIEPYDVTGTGTPIKIHGRAAGLSLGANSTAPFTLDGISSLNWKNGSSNGYMMKFNTNSNTINSNFDTFNITNGSITLTSGTISGNTNINLTLSGTISGGTISGATISGGNINGATISGGNINGATLGAINVTSGSISYTNINNAYISGGTINGTINAGGVIINAGSKILVTCTGSNPMFIPNGGNIGDNSASLTLCGVTLTGGDFTKLKNLQ